jgi:hypothetical protein
MAIDIRHIVEFLFVNPMVNNGGWLSGALCPLSANLKNYLLSEIKLRIRQCADSNLPS